MKKGLMCLISFTLLSTALPGRAHAQVAPLSLNQLQSQEEVSAFSVRGLPGINLNLWTEGFFVKSVTKRLPGKNVKATILNAYRRSSTQAQLFEVLLASLNKNFASPASYKLMVDGLFAAAKQLRGDSDTAKARSAVTLLNALAEETMYVMVTKFPSYMKLWKTVYYDLDTNECPRVATMNGLKVCQGDVVLSKGSQGSSSFLARIADEPANISHSTVAYVDPVSKQLLFVEALIEDGLKLRDPYADYMKHAKKKVMIYSLRPQGANDSTRAALLQEAIAGVDSMVNEMRASVADPMTQPAKPYDFSMNAKEFSEQFCSEAIYYSYTKTSLPEEYNPYPQNLWSKISGVKEDFFNRFMNIKTNRFPAPSDVELNPNYQVASLIFNLEHFGQDRIDVAMIDTLINMMQENAPFVSSLLEQFASFGNSPITHEQLEYLVKMKLVTPDQMESLKGKIPDRVSLKQLIFFAFLNEHLTPAVREQMSKAEKAAFAQGHQPLGPLTLRRLVKTELEAKIVELSQIADRLIELSQR